VSDNLDQLKDEVLRELSRQQFAVFLGRPGSIENTPIVFWDSDVSSDYRTFLGVAKDAGAVLIVFATRLFQEEELEDAMEQLDQTALPRDDRRTAEVGLRTAQTFLGRTCSIELAFNYQGQMYVYQVVADWYDEFLQVTDLLDITPVEDGDEPFGGYFSKN
jgi:hypothetical protein